jgi:predicted small integral membrane protein
MTARVAKTALVFGVALFYTLVVFNNVTDYASNYQFIRHVLLMDSTAPGNHGMWRAIGYPVVDSSFYFTIIAWEFAAMLLCWWGGLGLAKALKRDAQAFQLAKNPAIAGLTLGLLLWLVAFLAVGGEWFLMWQSKTWNGEEAAFRVFFALGIVLLLVIQTDTADQP